MAILTVQQRLDREGQGPQVGDRLGTNHNGIELAVVVSYADLGLCFLQKHKGGKTYGDITQHWYSNLVELGYTFRADGKPCEGEG